MVSFKRVFNLSCGRMAYRVKKNQRSGINNMWILKNSKDLLGNLKSRSFSQVSSIKLLIFFNSVCHPTAWQIKNPLKRNHLHESSYLLQDFEETPTHMSIKTNRLEVGHNSYSLVCRRPAETVSLITWNKDLSLRYPPSKLLIFQLYVPPYRMTN
jgi:hypothetical protein